MAGISGGIGPSRYAPVEAASSGALANGYSVRQAPPTTSARSSTRTSSPARASRAAATRPLWPAPITTTSAMCSLPLPVGEPVHELQAAPGVVQGGHLHVHQAGGEPVVADREIGRASCRERVWVSGV